MPIQVHIEVNGRPIKTIHIARETKNMGEGDINTYTALSKPATGATSATNRHYSEPPSYREWDAGVQFEHRRGDGIDVCVQKAFEALGENPVE